VTNARITHMDLLLSRALVCVDGELDLADVGEFKVEVRSVLARKPALILIDLRGCTFIDSSVIAALIELQNSLDGAGPTLAVIARREPRRVLRLTAVDEVMPVFETMVGAVNGAGRDRTATTSASP
jgi:anti-sigma B factor antagonist